MSGIASCPVFLLLILVLKWGQEVGIQADLSGGLLCARVEPGVVGTSNWSCPSETRHNWEFSLLLTHIYLQDLINKMSFASSWLDIYLFGAVFPEAL